MKGTIMCVEPSPLHRPKLGNLFHSDPPSLDDHAHDHDHDHEDSSKHRFSSAPATTTTFSNNASPYLTSPLNNQATSTSPFSKSPWLLPSTPIKLFHSEHFAVQNGLVGSIIRKEGHIYSLAVSGDLLYTGSDSKNIRVWKNLRDFTGFKSSSGLVKAIVISGGKIFTGHQDGKIRIWKVPHTANPTNHRRIGSLPSLRDYVKSSVNPISSKAKKAKHYDAVSSLSLDEEHGLLYSGSWDKTVKVWSVSDSKCLESIEAHCDAVNAVVTAFGCHVFTGSADGTVKIWRREEYEYEGNSNNKRENKKKKNRTKHVLEGFLLEQESAMTALAVNRWSAVVYGGSSDGAVNYWGRGKGNDERCFSHDGVLRGHKLAVLCVAVAGCLVVSGSADKSVCVWKREESGKHAWLSVLNGHTGPVKCIAAIEVVEEEEEECESEVGELVCNGKGSSDQLQRWLVYTGSLDKSVKVWRVSENAPELSVIHGWVPPRDSAAVANDDRKASLFLPGRISFSGSDR